MSEEFDTTKAYCRKCFGSSFVCEDCEVRPLRARITALEAGLAPLREALRRVVNEAQCEGAKCEAYIVGYSVMKQAAEALLSERGEP